MRARKVLRISRRTHRAAALPLSTTAPNGGESPPAAHPHHMMQICIMVRCPLTGPGVELEIQRRSNDGSTTVQRRVAAICGDPIPGSRIHGEAREVYGRFHRNSRDLRQWRTGLPPMVENYETIVVQNSTETTSLRDVGHDVGL